MAKKLKSCFASTLNEITASVKCVSPMTVVLKAKFTRFIAAHTYRKYGEKRRTLTRVSFVAS